VTDNASPDLDNHDHAHDHDHHHGHEHEHERDHDHDHDGAEFDESALDDAQAAIHEARHRLAGVPAEVVVSNHVMGLYELAAIHLSAEPPSLVEAALAIDAVGCLVEGLGPRLGADSETLANALSNIRLAFVQIKGTQA
jgi:hypothetical protein